MANSNVNVHRIRNVKGREVHVEPIDDGWRPVRCPQSKPHTLVFEARMYNTV